MTNVTALAPRNRMPSDLPAVLRELADQVEAGRVTGFVAGSIIDGEYRVNCAGSLTDNLVLATLLQRRATDEFLE